MSPWCPNPRQQSGSVLVLALLTMLALSLMGVGLGYIAYSQIDITNSQETRDHTLSAAETGIDVASTWLQGQMATAMPSQIQNFNSTALTTGATTDAGMATQKLSKLTYSVTLEPMASGAGVVGTGIGSDISNSDTLTATSYYKITSTGARDGTAGVQVEVIVSVTP